MAQEKNSGSGGSWFWVIIVFAILIVIAGQDKKTNSGGMRDYDMEAHKRRAHEMVDQDAYRSERDRQMTHELVDQMIDPRSDLNRSRR